MKVHELLATPDKWTQGAYRRDGDGNPVHREDKSAVSFCIIGACCECYELTERILKYDCIAHRLGLPGDEEIITWNDKAERTHAEVLALCKELDI